MIRYFGVRDEEFIQQGARYGFPVGILQPLPSSGGIHPLADEEQIVSYVEDGPEWSGNYPSEVEGSEEILHKLIEGEISRGWMEIVDRFESGAKPAKLALIPKKNFDEGVNDWADQPEDVLRKSFRVIEDYRRNACNNKVSMKETNALPSYQSLVRLLEHIVQLEAKTGSSYIIFESDIQSAYRTVPVIAAERGFLVAEVNSVKVRHTRLPMGLRSGAYVFSRIFSTLHRVLRKIMDPLGTGGLSYLDDNCWFIPKCIKEEAICILLLVPGACGVDYAWEKIHVDGNNTFGGFTITRMNLGGFVIRVPPRKEEKVVQQITSILESGMVKAETLQSLIGRLLFYTQMCPIYREGLSHLYGLSTVMNKKGLYKVKCSERTADCLTRWLQVVSSNFERVIKAVECGGRSGRQEDLEGLILADASTIALGCIVIRVTGTSEPGAYSRLLIEELKEIEETNVHARTSSNMVSLELTATLMGVLLAKKMGMNPSKMLVLSDSKSGIGALKKGFSAKIGPARLVAVITQIMSDGIQVSDLPNDRAYHIKGLLNVDADKISRDVGYAPPGLKRMYVSVAEVKEVLNGGKF